MLERLWRKGNSPTLLLGMWIGIATMEGSTCAVEFNSLWPHGLWPTRCFWNFPGKNTGAGCHFLLQGIVLTQGLNLRLLQLLHWQVDSLPLAPPGKPMRTVWSFIKILKIELPYDPAIPFLGIYPEEAILEKDTCTPMFIAALFTIARTWKQPKCPSAEV